MNPQETATIGTETPPARNVGSIPITRSPSQTATPAGKPGKTWEVGAPYIIDHNDAPDWRRIVVCTHTDGRCRYLCIHHNRRWPHVMQLSERSTPLAAFGIVLRRCLDPDGFGGIDGNQAYDSVAVYPDGKPRRWQAGKSNSMPLMASEPKYWRLDPQVAPKLIKWIQGNPPAVQQAKAAPKTITSTELKAELDAMVERARAAAELPAHDTAWESKFVLPLAEFMKQRGVQHVRVDLSGGTVRYALIPFNEPVQIFELVDATSEEQYFPLGVFFDAASAVLKAQDHFPQRWDGDHVGQAVSEVRVRNIGLYGGSYVVLWRGEWHYDYDAGGEWKLVEQQLGTLEKPLPITRA